MKYFLFILSILVLDSSGAYAYAPAKEITKTDLEIAADQLNFPNGFVAPLFDQTLERKSQIIRKGPCACSGSIESETPTKLTLSEVADTAREFNIPPQALDALLTLAEQNAEERQASIKDCEGSMCGG